MTTIAPGDARALTRALVKIDSRNPTLTNGAPGERECALFLRDVLHDWGFRTELQDAAIGRPNLVARIGTPRGGRSLMFNGHLDVVGTEGMTHAPFAAEESNGLLYGRGSADMKGGIAAMCAGAWRAAQTAIRGEIIIAAVADEEYDSAGTRALLRSGVRADGAIIAEPTNLSIMPAHRGFVWLEVTIAGRAAHGSRYDIGVDAIRHAGLLLAELDRLDAEELPLFTHPLLGRGSLHASLVEGGIGMSTYPDRCVLTLERRTIPGKSRATDFIDEVEAACERIRARRDTFSAEVRLLVTQGPSDVDVEAPIVRELQHSMEEHGEAGGIEGMSAWTDAALLNDAGIPTVLFGPGDISLAHAAEEYIPLDEIDRASEVFGSLARRWCF
ncbi:MAG: acetylornithine deacetylase or succinyl-diaminopimelate desuccinylase [Gemmatimonadetes bacterium]|nr:acetylornithine deacetylase or succinyl-diaminopimelate desuccinylase [Gemmatimonadota bacterium]